MHVHVNCEDFFQIHAYLFSNIIKTIQDIVAFYMKNHLKKASIVKNWKFHRSIQPPNFILL